MAADFMVSMVLQAVNDISPALVQITGQLDALKANMASLGASTAAVDTAAVETMAPTLQAAASQADIAAASITGMGAAAANVDTSTVETMAPQISAATVEAKNFENGMGNAGRAVQETANQVSKMKKGLTAVTHLGMGLTAAGAVLGYGIVKGLDMAGQLQSTLVTIQDTTGATKQQMQGLNDTILNTSANVSRFTDLDVAGFAQQLSSGGLGSTKNVQSLLMPMTQFADAQMYEGKVGAGSDAVNMAINMAHLLGHYDPTSLMKSLDTFNKYSVMEPGSSTDLYSTLKYLAPSARMLHMDETSTMQMAALANRVGLTGTHGGTNAADMILRLIPGYATGMGGKPSPGAMQAMQQLGMVDSKGQSQFFNSKGQITNFPQMIQTLINDAKKFNPEQLTTLFGHVFGAQGGRAASLFANPQTLEQLQGMANQLKQTKSIAQIQQDQQNSPQGQLNELKSNSMTAVIRIAQQLGTALNPFLVNLNAALGGLLKFEAQHPQLLKFIGVFTSIAASILLTVGPTLMILGGMGKLALFLKGEELAQGIKIFTSIGGGALEAIGPVAQFFSKATGWSLIWKGLNATMSFGGTVFKAVGSGILRMASSIAETTGLTKAWAGVQWLVNAAMEANPIIWVITGIVALIAVIALVVTHWKTCVHWLQTAWTWFNKLGIGAQAAIALIMPLVGIPAMIIAHWKQISSFFDEIWQHIAPVIQGVEKFLGIGSSSTPKVVSGSRGNTQVTNNHYYTVTATDPKGAAKEISNTQDKYYRSRYPLQPTR